MLGLYKGARTSVSWFFSVLVIIAIAGCSDGVVVPQGQVAPTDSAPIDSPNPESTPITPDPETPPAVIPDQPPPDDNRLAVHDGGFVGDFFSGQEQCADCHNGLTDASGNDVSIGTAWSTSMMANSARDPYWLAKVAAERQRNPSLATEIDDTCSRCHMPMANDTGRKNNTPVELFGQNSVLQPDNALFDHAMDGVSCTLCHQIQDDGLLGTPEGSSGNFSIGIAERRADRPAYGPYVDPVGVRMRTQVEFNPVYGEHITESKSCAVCHDLRTPAFGELSAGTGTDFFPEQMLYSEWLNSAYAQPGENEQTCQSCHMPEVSGSMLIASSGGGRLRDGFSQHSFLGANTVMQSILMENAQALGISVEPAEFEKSILRNREFLKTSAQVDIVSSEQVGSELITRVRVQNRAGHKLPSGFASRRALLQFTVTDSNGVIVFESGKLNEDGSIAGIDTDANSATFEPHYDVITTPDQVQVYEAIMGDAAEQVTHTLLSATSYLKDNRLLPLGFDKLSASDEIRTRGAAINDENFSDAGDLVEYRVPVQNTDQVTIQVTLLYQPLAYGHLQDLFSERSAEEVAYFEQLFVAAPFKSETLGSDTTTLSIQ